MPNTESITRGNSTIAKTLSAPPQSVGQRWNGLSTGVKIGIGASIGGVLILVIIFFAFYCIKQRRAGRRERAAEDLAYEKDTAGLLQYRTVMGTKNWDRF